MQMPPSVQTHSTGGVMLTSHQQQQPRPISLTHHRGTSSLGRRSQHPVDEDLLHDEEDDRRLMNRSYGYSGWSPSKKQRKTPVGGDGGSGSRGESNLVSEQEVESILGLTMICHWNNKQPMSQPSQQQYQTTTSAGFNNNQNSPQQQQQQQHQQPQTIESSTVVAPPVVHHSSLNAASMNAQVMPPPLSSLVHSQNDRHSDDDDDHLEEVVDGVPPGWRGRGTPCEVLYQDKWHRGVVLRYDFEKCVIRTRRTIDQLVDLPDVPVDIHAEKHRICWEPGKFTAQSNFA